MTNPAKTVTTPKGSATSLAALTVSDSVGIGADAPNAIMVTTAGVYRIIAKDDSASVDVYCAAGVPIALSPKQIKATGSVASTGVVGLYSK